MSSPDVEKQQQECGRPRSRALDCCLITSVITLFVLVLGSTATFLFLYKTLRDDMEHFHPSPPKEIFSAVAASRMPRHVSSSYKAENFAYLRATSSELKTGVMQWESILYGNSKTVGSRYEYNNIQHHLKVQQKGSYFLYIQLNITCNYKCENGTVNIVFKDQNENVQLSCPVELSTKNFKPITKQCWTVIPHLEKDSKLTASLYTELELDLKSWRLEMNESGFGMFLVDGPEDD